MMGNTAPMRFPAAKTKIMFSLRATVLERQPPVRYGTSELELCFRLEPVTPMTLNTRRIGSLASFWEIIFSGLGPLPSLALAIDAGQSQKAGSWGFVRGSGPGEEVSLMRRCSGHFSGHPLPSDRRR